MSRPFPDTRYAVFFTPRSGSSYLSDLITSTNALGDAAEVFNHQLAHGIADAMGATSLEDYVAKMLRARNTNGVFGAELTWPDLLNMFHNEKRFLASVQPTHFLWLTRQDIVAQAVSVMAMVQTGVGHTKHTSLGEIDRSRNAVVYKGRYLKRIIARLAWSERQVENFFKNKKIEPLRLKYEILITSPKSALLDEVANHLGIVLQLDGIPESDHKKLSGSKNVEFAERFRAENATFINGIERRRVRS